MLNRAKQKWKEITDGWFGSIIYIVLGFAIAYSINIGLSFVLHTDTPVVAVFSDSMVPMLLRGDMVIVYGTNDIKTGDIIVFDSPSFSYPIIHRVYNMTSNGIQTKGDNNKYVDPCLISASSIHGKAGPKIPLLGWVKIWFVNIVSAFSELLS